MSDSEHVRRLEATITETERRLASTRDQLEAAREHHTTLQATLRAAREKLVSLRTELADLGQPPLTIGVVERVHGTTGTAEEVRSSEIVVDVWLSTRQLRCRVLPDLDTTGLVVGAQVALNEAQAVAAVLGRPVTGEVATVRETLADGERAVVSTSSDDQVVVRLAGELRSARLRPGSHVLVDRKVCQAWEQVPVLDVEDLTLEEVPDVHYADIGGLGRQIADIRDAVELPFLHRDLFATYQLEPPRGILLYGPPGCGKTMIAKAVANSLASKVAERLGRGADVEARSWFLNVKGPELLNKYVGETERHIRAIFTKARDKAADGVPVIVFFDEMDSLFRTRGTGVSSDVETTIVPQLLAEIDGVEALGNVIVIGATNREDMIDPALMRAGRLDVKIKIDRPDAEAATEIFAGYLGPDVPLHADDLAEGGGGEATRREMIDRVVAQMYAESTENEFLEVTYAGGDVETLHFKDFNSGAMIKNIVARAKKLAVKEQLGGGAGGLRVDHLLQACSDEFVENEDLPNTTNPDDWARISGKKGERIVAVRPLFSSKRGSERGVATIESTGQYL